MHSIFYYSRWRIEYWILAIYACNYDFFVHKIGGLWPWKPFVWKQCIQARHQVVLWLFAHEKFLTPDRQCYISNKKCLLCKRADESTLHLFFYYDVTKVIWQKIRDWLGMHKLMGSANTKLFVTNIEAAPPSLGWEVHHWQHVSTTFGMLVTVLCSKMKNPALHW